MLKVFRSVAFSILACTLVVADIASAVAQSQVTDEMGYPLSDVLVARLEWSMLQMRPAEDLYTTITITGADGTFTANPTTSKSLLLLSKPRYVTVPLDGQKPLPKTIALGLHAEIGGRLYDDKGTTIIDAAIGPVLPIDTGEEADASREPPPLAPIYGHTGARGYFRIGGLVPGQYSFLVQAPGLPPEIGLATTGQETSVTLPSSGTTVTGILLGSKDRQPQPGIIVEAHAGLMRLYSTTDIRGEFAFGMLQNAEWKFNTTPSPLEKPKAAPVVQNGRSDKGRELVLLHNQGVTIAGQFLNAETSAPIPNMPLRLNTFEADSPASTSTDAAGYFRFEKIDAFRNISLAFDGLNYAFRSRENGQWGDRITISTQPARDITTITAALTPRALVRGRVVGPGNRPVPGADIVLRTVEDVDQGYGEMRRPSVFTVRSNSSGQFEMAVFPSGMYELRATAPFLGMLPQTYEASSTSPKELVVEMQRVVTLTGRAIDADGAPLNGARVEFFASAQDSATLVASGRSDTRGSFSVDSTFPEKVRAVATHPCYDTAVTTEITVLAKDNRPIEFRFPAGSAFTAQVLTESGSAVEDAIVQIFPVTSDTEKQTSGIRQLTRRTGFDGRTVFHLNAPSIENIVVRHRDFAPFTAANISLPQQKYEIRLKAYPSVSVTITAPPSVPEESLRYIVWLLRANTGKPTATEPAPSQFVSVRHQQASFGKALFENVEPGWYKAAITTDDESMYSESKAAQLKAESRNLELELPVATGASLEGRITDEETGDPVTGANVHVQLQGATPAEFEVVSKPSDSQGRYSIAVLPSAIVVISARHLNYSDQAQIVQLPASGKLTVNFKMNKSVTLLSGQVRLDGKPLADATIVVYPSEDMARWIGSAVTDEKGHYSIEGVPEGSRLLIAEALWGTDAKGLRKRQNVLVRGRSSTANVDFRALVRVAGRVQINSAEANPTAKHMLYFTSQNTFGDVRRVVLGPEGNYEVFLEPGPYTVGLQDGPGLHLDVPEGGNEVQVHFEFDELARISGLNAAPQPQLE
ncbi:MAG: carboxypeptidase regulatory-like domain-containing protein [Candidatus Sumerlaeaceae bacterium]